jgi:hypothetical protein
VSKGCGKDKESSMDKNRKGLCELWLLGHLKKNEEKTKGRGHFACLQNTMAVYLEDRNDMTICGPSR